ncbi:MAG: hypothetical protein GTN36_06135 [Candidatus Aenigmarchaeota archaeon]|nr:hypothetical protein [Candidatus Aenigmarchaeota archaeon]
MQFKLDYIIILTLTSSILISGCVQEEVININNVNKINIIQNRSGWGNRYNYDAEIIKQNNEWNLDLEECAGFLLEVFENCSSSTTTVERSKVELFLNKLSLSIRRTKPTTPNPEFCRSDSGIKYKIEIDTKDKTYIFILVRGECYEPWEVTVDNKTMWARYDLINDVRNFEKEFTE